MHTVAIIATEEAYLENNLATITFQNEIGALETDFILRTSGRLRCNVPILNEKQLISAGKRLRERESKRERGRHIAYIRRGEQIMHPSEQKSTGNVSSLR